MQLESTKTIDSSSRQRPPRLDLREIGTYMLPPRQTCLSTIHRTREMPRWREYEVARSACPLHGLRVANGRRAKMPKKTMVEEEARKEVQKKEKRSKIAASSSGAASALSGLRLHTVENAPLRWARLQTSGKCCTIAKSSGIILGEVKKPSKFCRAASVFSSSVKKLLTKPGKRSLIVFARDVKKDVYVLGRRRKQENAQLAAAPYAKIVSVKCRVRKKFA